METKELISPDEEHRLEELEAVIKQDLKGFIRVGMALKEIREDRLYRGQYTSWKDYLKSEWDLSKTHANCQINAFTVVENLKRIDSNCGHLAFTLPMNEAQVRPLTLLPPVQQRSAWEQVLERTNGKVTALQVTKIVEEYLEQTKSQEKAALQKKVTKEVTVPDDFTEAFRSILNVIDKHRSSRWKNFKRKKAIEFVKALEQYLEPQKA